MVRLLQSTLRGTAALLLLTWISSIAQAGPASERETFVNPPEIRSVKGVLRSKFVLQPTELTIDGRKVQTNTYNGLYTPPTLRVKPGDVVELEFENRCPQPSNIHFHGLTVSPLNNGDNIFTRVDPGHTFHYRFRVPKDHTPGLYYYHAHAHGVAERQITFGFTGAFVVEGQLDAYPALAKAKEQIMVLKDIQISPFGTVPQDIVTSRKAIRSVNSLVNPVLHMQPGESQVWRIANTTANLYYRLTLGGETFWVIAEDGNPTTRMLPVKEYLLGPSARVEVVAQFSKAGEFVFKTEKVRTGPAGDGYPAAPIVTVVCSGAPQKALALPLKRLDCCAVAVADYTKLNVTKKRLIVFNETDSDFRVNDKIFDENRIDTRVPLGSVEEWTIRNATDELHQFHIHQVDFQVVEIDGKPVDFTGHRDNFVIPIRGEAKIIIPFTDPVIVGAFVYHCHIIEHEDGGMMATIEVYDPKKSAAAAAPEKHLVTKAENPDAKGGSIQLTDQYGKTFRGKDSAADLLLLSFGYTRCEGACPRTVALLHETLDLLKDTPGRVQPVFVSIDPERDSTESLRTYAEESGMPLVALTGDRAAVADVAKSFGVAVKKRNGAEDGSYSISHSTDVFLTTRDGQVVKRFELIAPAEDIARAARERLARVPAAAPASPVVTASTQSQP